MGVTLDVLEGKRPQVKRVLQQQWLLLLLVILKPSLSVVFFINNFLQTNVSNSLSQGASRLP